MPRAGVAAQAANRKPAPAKRGPEALVAAAKEPRNDRKLSEEEKAANELLTKSLNRINDLSVEQRQEDCGKTKIEWALLESKHFKCKAKIAELNADMKKGKLREAKLTSDKNMLISADKRAEEAQEHEFRLKYMLLQDLAQRVMGGKDSDGWKMLTALWAQEWAQTKAAVLPDPERPEVLRKRLAEEGSSSDDDDEADGPKKPRSGNAPPGIAAGAAAMSRAAAASPPPRMEDDDRE